MDLPRRSLSHVLLTGAGFTRNFGAPLADEMWSWIFNHPDIRSSERIHDLLLREFDFEYAYHQVMSGNYSKDECSAIHNAVLSAYEVIDRIVLQWRSSSDSPHKVNRTKVNNLIARFAGNKNECGFFFTLNQDLFVERKYSREDMPAPLTPGLRAPTNVARFSTTFEQVIDGTTRCKLPDDEEVEGKFYNDLRSAQFLYVKLHGSYDWQKHDGSTQLVIGGGKEEIISKEPILRLNWELFKSVLRQGNCRLIIIGYSFRDKHVNKEIANAIGNYGLRLIVLDPASPREFFEKRLKPIITFNKQLKSQAIEGYLPFTLEELFPLNKTSPTDAAKYLYDLITG